MEIDHDDELRPYANIVLDKDAGWEAKQLAGRAVAAIAHAWIRRTRRKARLDVQGPVVNLERQFELYERAHRMWQHYAETSDRAALLSELGDIVADLESLAPE